MNEIRTGIGIWASRHLDPKVAGPYAAALQATGQLVS
jgi:phthiodiolone/phenolphthiodiolone dimycocerosates ketoreductase